MCVWVEIASDICHAKCFVVFSDLMTGPVNGNGGGVIEQEKLFCCHKSNETALIMYVQDGSK